MATIGIIGAGNIGSQLARLAVSHGYDVVISNSRGPHTWRPWSVSLARCAQAATVVEAATAGDIVVVTIPLKHYRSVPVEPLAGKVVVDTNNYYPERDGAIAELDNESTTTLNFSRRICPNRSGQGVQPHLRLAAHHRRTAQRHQGRARPGYCRR
jgi:predicted dinucleotide-binding enzyme